MADRVPERHLRFDVVVAASTTQAAPAIQNLAGLDGRLADIRVIIPVGHGGQTGIRFRYSGELLVPWGSGWIVGIPDDILFPVEWDVPKQVITAEAYNTGTKSHTFYVSLHVVYPVPALVPVSTIPGDVLGPPADGGAPPPVDGGGGGLPPPPVILPPLPVNVPRLIGQTLAFAEDLLKGQGFVLHLEGPVPPEDIDHDSVGITHQDPPPLTSVSPGATVTLRVAWPGEFAPVPDVVGMRLEAARDHLAARGFAARVVTSPEPNAPRRVTHQHPAAGKRALRGSIVRLRVEHHR